MIYVVGHIVPWAIWVAAALFLGFLGKNVLERVLWEVGSLGLKHKVPWKHRIRGL